MLGLFEWTVTVVSAEYNISRHSWMYTVKDHKGEEVKEKVEERRLGGEGEG